MDFRPVTCAECGESAHILLPHLQDAHGWTATQYHKQHPGQPVTSHLGGQLVRTYVDATLQARPTKQATVSALFGWPKEPFEVTCYEGQARWLPPGDDAGYHYDYACTLGLLYALERETRNAVWLAGPSGTGKTSLVMNVCRKLGREVVRINLDSSVSRSDLIGDWVVRDGSTHFVHGLLPTAMRRGAVLLLDEFDLASPYLLALFRPVLEDSPRLVILENGGEVVTPHPSFRVVATANTWGNGDSTGLYGTSQHLSLADRQRFSLFLEMSWLEPKVEAKMLTLKVPELDADEAEQFVQIANAMRAACASGKLEEALSPRQLVNWAEVYDTIGSVIKAAEVTFLRPLTPSSQMAVRQIIADSGAPLVKPHELDD